MYKRPNIMFTVSWDVTLSMSADMCAQNTQCRIIGSCSLNLSGS
jgi:hypothetical protein